MLPSAPYSSQLEERRFAAWDPHRKGVFEADGPRKRPEAARCADRSLVIHRLQGLLLTRVQCVRLGPMPARVQLFFDVFQRRESGAPARSADLYLHGERKTAPAILINLDRSTDRLRNMTLEFDRAGVQFERFPAVLGTDLPRCVRSYFFGSTGERISPLGPGEIGCYASHLCLWQRIAAGEYGAAVLVCEDDLRLPVDLPDLIARILITIPSSWDIVRLSSPSTHVESPIASLGQGRKLVRYWQAPVMSGSYLISQAGAAKFLKAGIRMRPIDVDLARPWLFGVDSYGVSPPPIVQTEFDSVISEMGGRHHSVARKKRFFRRPTHNKLNRLIYNLRTMGFRHWLTCLASRSTSRA
jgi:glycosyl transferase, family 25